MAGGEFTGVFAWMFLPRIAASYTLKLFHWVLHRTAPHLVPAPASAAYARHQRLSYIFVIFTYLLYTIWDTERSMGTNYYGIFGLRPSDFSQDQLRRNFRRLSLSLHPDKNPQGHQYFIVVQSAYKVLADPVLRAVYDRAGPEALMCQTCSTASDFILASIPRRLGVYTMYVLGSVALQVFRIGTYGKYWRYVAIGGFLALEMAMLVRKTEPLFIRSLLWLLPRRTGFEIALILQQLSTCLFIGMNQIGPQLMPQERNVSTIEMAKQLLGGIEAVNSEVVNSARRKVDMYRGSGLQRVLGEETEKEMALGMALGMSSKFRAEFNDRAEAERRKAT
ncbi:hypothetical protein GGI07_002431 [Coemansia sp. Benny D115]|nr:hypothetical protein GGI07_002431 [Coemansia sp. Benny D115]